MNRIIGLQDFFNISSRMIDENTSNNDLLQFQAINWNIVEEELKEQRIKSNNYLERIFFAKVTKMDLFKNKKDCCGCGACKNACPQNSIKMIPDEFGMIYPIIDKSKYIDCGLCKKSCGYQNYKNFSIPKDTYAISMKDTLNVLKSLSGGAFQNLKIMVHLN